MTKVKRMKAEIRKLWVKALRSEKYEQTEGRLKGDGGYCCLGVLCELHRKEVHSNARWGRGIYDGNEAGLPNEVIEWAGLDESVPQAQRRINLITLNDEEKWDFNQIAQEIEDYY